MENVMVDWQHVARALIIHSGSVTAAAERVGSGERSLRMIRDGKTAKPQIKRVRNSMLFEYSVIGGVFSGQPGYEL